MRWSEAAIAVANGLRLMRASTARYDNDSDWPILPTERPPPGLFVLGMHRSGTSVVAGIIERLGVGAGPATSLFDADEFNQDGYWEQRPVVQCNDDLLRAMKGFASAPPARGAEPPLHLAQTKIAPLLAMFDGPWFIKDPRMCLLLPAWQHATGTCEPVLVVARHPVPVALSLRRRNGYVMELGLALWERYVGDLLVSLAGRRCIFVQYEMLLASPGPLVAELCDWVADHLGASYRSPARVAEAVELVRCQPSAGRQDDDALTCDLTTSQRELMSIAAGLTGHHDAFVVPDLPTPAKRSQRILERRRRMLLWADRTMRSSTDMRAASDRRSPRAAR